MMQWQAGTRPVPESRLRQRFCVFLDGTLRAEGTQLSLQGFLHALRAPPTLRLHSCRIFCLTNPEFAPCRCLWSSPVLKCVILQASSTGPGQQHRL